MSLTIPLLALGLALAPAELSEREKQARLEFIQLRLDRARGPARLWYFGWLSGYGAGLALRTSFALTSEDPGTRLDSRTGALTLGASLMVTLVTTPRSLFAADRLRSLQALNRNKGYRNLFFAEQLLRDAAFWEQLGQSWFTHVAGAAVNLSAALYLGAHARRWNSAVIAGAGGVAVTELKILTQPTSASDALVEFEHMKARSWTQSAKAPLHSRPGNAVTLTITAAPLLLVIAGTF